MKTLLLCAALALSPIAASAAPYPTIALSNQNLSVLMYAPDATNGFYRGPRFEGSGMVVRVDALGHRFFGDFLAEQLPTNSAAGAGLAEEFRVPLGYDEAAPGGAFIRIGVGLVQRGSGGFHFGQELNVLWQAPWTVTRFPDRVAFVQRLVTNGYGYEYEKAVVLDPKGPGLRLVHRLKNIGTKPFTNTHYNHHFIRIDEAPVGVDYAASFNFYHVCPSPAPGLVRVDRNVITFASNLLTNHAFLMKPAGFTNSSGALTSVVYHKGAKAGVRIEAPFPVHFFATYIDARTVSPEPFYRIDLAPGQEQAWTLAYSFFTGAFPVVPEKELDAFAWHGISEIRVGGAPLPLFDGAKTNFILLLDGPKSPCKIEAKPVNPADKVIVQAPAKIPGRATVSYRTGDARVKPAVYHIDFRLTDLIATCSGPTSEGTGPRYTLDGDPDTRCSVEGDGAWIQWDLGRVRALPAVALAWYMGDKRLSFYELSVSSEGSAWQTVFKGASSGKGTTLETNAFTPPLRARFVRYTGFGNSSSKWNSVLDVEFPGAK